MSDRPRVFHLITRLLHGGAEAKTIETVTGLDGYEFVVGHGAAFEPEQVERLKAAGVRTQRFASIRHYNPVTAVPAVLAVARFIRKEEFDLVHTHSTEAGIIGRCAATLAGTPAVVHTVHGVPFASDRNRVLEAFVLACERVTARWSDRLIANADAIAEDYLDRGIGRPEQYRTVYSGIDVGAFRNAEPAPDITGSGTRILMVGRLADGKGFGDLLRAVARLEGQEVSVYLVGDGPLRASLERMIEKRGLEDVVTVMGYRTDVAAIMAACDVFVLPSYREGTPRVITEAMASGLPIVATDIAGIPEQVEHGTNGYLIEPGDVDMLATHLTTLCSSTTVRTRMGVAGKERVDRFSNEQMLADLEGIYRDLLLDNKA